MVPENLQASSTSSLGLGVWQIYTEKVGLWDKPDFVQSGLKDHLNVTKDTTDYLWYTTRSALLSILYSTVLLFWIVQLNLHKVVHFA